MERDARTFINKIVLPHARKLAKRALRDGWAPPFEVTASSADNVAAFTGTLNPDGTITPSGFKVNGTPKYPVRIQLRKSVLAQWETRVPRAEG